jgi:protein-S-isoprenylcysteine O-methyltransferase Ste14
MNRIMENKLIFILAGVCVITHVVRLVYEILKHKKLLKADKLTFVIIFTNMMILWISWFALCSLDPFTIHLAAIIRYTGISLTISGCIIFLTGLLTIKTLESYEGDLITKGIYSIIRHPMYLGFILWLIGFPVFHGAILSFILSLIFIANVLYWRYLEEKELEKRFSSYQDYKKTTIF